MASKLSLLLKIWIGLILLIYSASSMYFPHIGICKIIQNKNLQMATLWINTISIKYCWFVIFKTSRISFIIYMEREQILRVISINSRLPRPMNIHWMMWLKNGFYRKYLLVKIRFLLFASGWQTLLCGNMRIVKK